MARQTSKTASKPAPGRLGPGGPLIGRRATPPAPKPHVRAQSPKEARIAKRAKLIEDAKQALGEAEF